MTDILTPENVILLAITIISFIVNIIQIYY